MPARKQILISVLAIHLASLPTLSFAGLSEWFTESAESEDGKYILVTISDRPLDVELADDRLNAAEREHTEYLRTTYPTCGLYRNDGSTTPLWTYDGRWSSDLVIAPDGECAIFPGDWTRYEYGTQAVTFMRRGQQLRSYTDQELIPGWIMKAVLNGFTPPNCVGTDFNSQKMIYIIRTNQHEEFTFDVTTGELIEFHSPFPAYFAVAGVTMCGLVALAIYWMRPKKRPRTD
jgi:hypothetical protein